MSSQTMRQMWCEQPGQLEVRERPIFEPNDNEVLIKIAYTGICPWDVRAFSGKASSVLFPRVLGHETSGYVAAVGSKVKHLSVGQPVVADYIVKCGSCLACRRGRPNLCRRPTYQQFSGGYGDYTVLPQQNIYPLRPETDMQSAAFMEPLACVVRGQDLLRLQPSEVELVVGLGPIGLMHMQVAQAHGAQVIAADLLPARLEKAKALGADWTVNPQETDLGAFVKDITDGWGADAAVIAVGSARLVEQTLPMLAPGGRLNIFAGIYPRDELRIDPNLIHYGEFILTGSSDSTPVNMQRALDFIQNGQVDTVSLVSHLLPLEELGRGLEMVKNAEGLKIMMEVNGEAAKNVAG
ncbi:MAG: alcohol dehydrogenase catalytic domain-containing protein [Anaerolineales bacterium]|nr:alcohol dehydrogenase catalytic domain-containing protein [Anaerolineales bacterium]